MMRTAGLALILGSLGLALFPAQSHACIRGYPADKIVAIDAALKTARLDTAKRDEVTALRDAATKPGTAGDFYDANRAADRALALLDVKLPVPKNPTRC